MPIDAGKLPDTKQDSTVLVSASLLIFVEVRCISIDIGQAQSKTQRGRVFLWRVLGE